MSFVSNGTSFELTREGLQAFRIEGKRPAQFRRQFPDFAEHWELTAFGQPWLDDYASAAPVRRPDLDLKGVRSGGTHSPFALAFYWVRFLYTGNQSALVFLPGFKADKIAKLTMTPSPTSRGLTWRATLQHPYLSASPPPTAVAMISADGHLQLLSFELHGSAGSAGGIVHQDGCTGHHGPVVADRVERALSLRSVAGDDQRANTGARAALAAVKACGLALSGDREYRPAAAPCGAAASAVGRTRLTGRRIAFASRSSGQRGMGLRP